VGYWTFDGPSIDWHTNTVADMSGQGNTGTLVSMSTTSSPSPGKIGQALTFVYKGQHVSGPNIPSLANATKFTISAWMKRSFDTATVTLGQGPLNDYESIELWDDGKVYFEVGNGGVTGCDYAVPGTSWHHVVMAYDGSQMGDSNRLKTYVDGQRVDSTCAGIPANTGDNDGLPFKIGFYDAGTVSSDGSIDDVRVYNRALSASEVKQLYNASR
jgi:large repetitive protein